MAKGQVDPAILAHNDDLRLENKILKEQLNSGNKKLNQERAKEVERSTTQKWAPWGRRINIRTRYSC